MKEFSLTVSSPDGNIFSGKAVFLSLRGAEGDLAVLADHAPFVTSVQPCICCFELQDGTEKACDLYDAAYVELRLITEHQGEPTATRLFNYGEQFVFNYFELRGAAAKLTEGWTLEQIRDYTIENGCDPTDEEYRESAQALQAFRSQQAHTFSGEMCL